MSVVTIIDGHVFTVFEGIRLADGLSEPSWRTNSESSQSQASLLTRLIDGSFYRTLPMKTGSSDYRPYSQDTLCGR